MNAAGSVAERLLALETAVAELQQKLEGTTSSGEDRLAQALGNFRLAALLTSAGYGSPEAVAAATDDALLAIDGIGDKALALIRSKVSA